MDPDLRLAPEGNVFDEYLAFVEERHRIWELRSMGLPAPWTRSPILATKKFTNDFRVLDPGSQYVLRMVQDADTPEDVVLRAFLYRLTNTPDVWVSYFGGEDGRWPILRDVESGLLEDFLLRYRGPMFSSAYMISPGIANKGMTRPEWLAMTVREAFTPGGAHALHPTVFKVGAVASARVNYLCGVPRIAGFLALQIATDIGYSDLVPGDEDEFVVVGPGSRRGLQALGLPTTSSAIRTLHAEIRSRVTLDVNGTPRPLSLMDVQNTLCEFGKYHGLLTDRGNRARRFTPAPFLSSTHTDPIYPNHWS